MIDLKKNRVKRRLPTQDVVMNKRVSPVIEQYLQTIYSLAFHSPLEKVKSVHLKERFGSSPSTVHATLSRMKRDGLITFEEHKQIMLTSVGKKMAEEITRRHRLVETFLYKTLGIPWHEVHLHASSWAHGISPLVEEKLTRFLGFPKSCPHGSPFPGLEQEFPPEDMFYLNEAAVGDRLQVIVIGEQLEEQIDTLELLNRKNLVPGSVHQIREKFYQGDTVSFQTSETQITLTLLIASQIGVRKIGTNS